jgi:hypothetical protein
LSLIFGKFVRFWLTLIYCAAHNFALTVWLARLYKAHVALQQFPFEGRCKQSLEPKVDQSRGAEYRVRRAGRITT